MGKRFNTLADCRRFLGRVANDLDQDRITTDKARALAYIVSNLQRIIESGDLERRLEELEQQMGDDKR